MVWESHLLHPIPSVIFWLIFRRLFTMNRRLLQLGSFRPTPEKIESIMIAYKVWALLTR